MSVDAVARIGVPVEKISQISTAVSSGSNSTVPKAFQLVPEKPISVALAAPIPQDRKEEKEPSAEKYQETYKPYKEAKIELAKAKAANKPDGIKAADAKVAKALEPLQKLDPRITDKELVKKAEKVQEAYKAYRDYAANNKNDVNYPEKRQQLFNAQKALVREYAADLEKQYPNFSKFLEKELNAPTSRYPLSVWDVTREYP